MDEINETNETNETKLKRIAVVGGREFSDYVLLAEELQRHMPFILVSGGARGADSLAERFANKHGLRKLIFEADWNKYGKSAGYRRNVTIVEHADLVIAFWDGKSKGTKHTIDIAEKKGVPSNIVSY